MTDTTPKNFSVNYPRWGETRTVTIPGTSQEDVLAKLIEALGRHQAITAQNEYYHHLAVKAPEGSPQKEIAENMWGAFSRTHAHDVLLNSITVEGVDLEAIAIDENKFLDHLTIEEIPGPKQISEPGLYELVLEVTCEAPEELEERYLDETGCCNLDGMHRLVFRHEDHNLSGGEAMAIGRDIFAQRMQLDEIGEFTVFARTVSDMDHAADFTHTHGIYAIEAEPTPAPGM